MALHLKSKLQSVFIPLKTLPFPSVSLCVHVTIPFSPTAKDLRVSFDPSFLFILQSILPFSEACPDFGSFFFPPFHLDRSPVMFFQLVFPNPSQAPCCHGPPLGMTPSSVYMEAGRVLSPLGDMTQLCCHTSQRV